MDWRRMRTRRPRTGIARRRGSRLARRLARRMAESRKEEIKASGGLGRKPGRGLGCKLTYLTTHSGSWSNERLAGDLCLFN